jgi:CBS domain-containing protein
LIPRERWDTTTVGDATRPLRELQIVAPETRVLDALKLAASNGVDAMPVVEDGKLQGIVFRSQLVHALQGQSEVKSLQAYGRLLYGTGKVAESNA